MLVSVRRGWCGRVHTVLAGVLRGEGGTGRSAAGWYSPSCEGPTNFAALVWRRTGLSLVEVDAKEPQWSPGALAAEKGIWHLPCASQPVLPVSRHDSISQPFPKALLPAAEARSWEEVPPICCNSRYRSVGSCVSQSGLIALMQAEQASMKESR